MNYISKDKISELLEYREGKLYWVHPPKKLPKLLGKRAGRKDKYGYIKIGIDGVYYLEHRLVFCLFYGYMPKQIDHINRIKDDNRIENLRAASQEENNRNKTPCGKSKYLGVLAYEAKRNNKPYTRWVAQICNNGVKKHIGCFETEEAAALAYNKKALELHGEFANLNQI